jgi:hypothetical protein
MERYVVTLSPLEFLTHQRNLLTLTLKKTGDCDTAEVSMKFECRLVAGGTVKERYLFGEQAFPVASSSDPLQLEWELAIVKKGPLTFSSPLFSLLHAVLVTIRDRDGRATTLEIPVQVVPGSSTEREEH